MLIYSDATRNNLVEQTLYEGLRYNIDFENADSNIIENEILKSKLSQFILWQPGNRFATLQIINFIGNIYFFKKTYDVRSQKFLHNLKGTDQFKIILDEIQQLSKNIIFTYQSPSFSIRQVDYSDYSPSLLLVFNYFKNIVLNWPVTTNLKTEFEKILSNPHFKYTVDYKIDKIEKIKKVNHKVIKSLIVNNKFYVQLSEQHNHLNQLPIVNLVSHNSEEHRYFPVKALMQIKHLSYDTNENRFIKFFFVYIENIAFRVCKIAGLPQSVIIESHQLRTFARSILEQPFFNDVGPINNIPTYSTVLQNRVGYKDIFSHFIQCRFGIRHIFDEFMQQAMSIDLKRISEIYEYWVFYKIALTLLGDDIVIEQQDAVLKDNELVYSVCFRHDNIKIFYNQTASKSRATSYSVELRPDITVYVETNTRLIKLIFDAKYKVRTVNETIKPEDIQKMHTYLDAIKDTEFAIAIYPGREFKFYEKDIDQPIKNDVQSISEFKGVGALPLIPGDENTNRAFNDFFERIKDLYIR